MARSRGSNNAVNRDRSHCRRALPLIIAGTVAALAIVLVLPNHDVSYESVLNILKNSAHRSYEYFSVSSNGAVLENATARGPVILKGLDESQHTEPPSSSLSISEEVVDSAAKVASKRAAPEEFDTLENMLHWAIDHSDPEKLKSGATEAKKMIEEEIEKRRADLKDLMSKLHTPSDAELMKIALKDLNNATSTVAQRRRALYELLELVLPLDNAKDLDKLGGLKTVVDELAHEEAELRMLAAWVIGQAVQNSGEIQDRLLELGAMPSLLAMITSEHKEAAVKALYATSGMVRNNLAVQSAFFGPHGGGAALLQRLLSNPLSDARLCKKALFLLTDLAQQETGEEGGVEGAGATEAQEVGKGEGPAEKTETEREKGKGKGTRPLDLALNKELLSSVLALTSSSDLDMREKALLALQTFVGEGAAGVLGILKSECGAESVLNSVHAELSTKALWVEGDQVSFAEEIAKLCLELMKQMGFHPKS